MLLDVFCLSTYIFSHFSSPFSLPLSLFVLFFIHFLSLPNGQAQTRRKRRRDTCNRRVNRPIKINRTPGCRRDARKIKNNTNT